MLYKHYNSKTAYGILGVIQVHLHYHGSRVFEEPSAPSVVSSFSHFCIRFCSSLMLQDRILPFRRSVWVSLRAAAAARGARAGRRYLGCKTSSHPLPLPIMSLIPRLLPPSSGLRAPHLPGECSGRTGPGGRKSTCAGGSPAGSGGPGLQRCRYSHQRSNLVPACSQRVQ